jgi:hypothetical protein
MQLGPHPELAGALNRAFLMFFIVEVQTSESCPSNMPSLREYGIRRCSNRNARSNSVGEDEIEGLLHPFVGRSRT